LTSRPGFYIRRFGPRPAVRLGFSERPESALLAHSALAPEMALPAPDADVLYNKKSEFLERWKVVML
jgi:hypothetical protein